jgi:hypothetical protein
MKGHFGRIDAPENQLEPATGNWLWKTKPAGINQVSLSFLQQTARAYVF